MSITDIKDYISKRNKDILEEKLNECEIGVVVKYNKTESKLISLDTYREKVEPVIGRYDYIDQRDDKTVGYLISIDNIDFNIEVI